METDAELAAREQMEADAELAAHLNDGDRHNERDNGQWADDDDDQWVVAPLVGNFETAETIDLFEDAR